ncbi:hypothetical protein FKY78_13755 [Enterococcus faecalis]|nr:hypothetical protein [Enterococcus faecalis]QGI54393.1 hypothetical protein EYB36_00035 [Enterococcus faecalis R712]EGO8395794.1 hypothetical protein [Enterococcus faecalis]EGO8456407.1 hypothetical protein [Enterococcus faecalis]EGO8777543.1 hypothetical protein [Enterococcus faecalis]
MQTCAFFSSGKGNESVVPRRCGSPCSKTNGLTAALNTSQLNVLYPFVPIGERFLFLLVPRLTEKSIDTSCSLWDHKEAFRSD